MTCQNRENEISQRIKIIQSKIAQLDDTTFLNTSVLKRGDSYFITFDTTGIRFSFSGYVNGVPESLKINEETRVIINEKFHSFYNLTDSEIENRILQRAYTLIGLFKEINVGYVDGSNRRFKAVKYFIDEYHVLVKISSGNITDIFDPSKVKSTRNLESDWIYVEFNEPYGFGG